MPQLQADNSGLITHIQKSATLKLRAPDEPLMKQLCLETGNVHQQVKEVAGHTLARTLFSWLKSEMGSYARTEITGASEKVWDDVKINHFESSFHFHNFAGSRLVNFTITSVTFTTVTNAVVKDFQWSPQSVSIQSFFSFLKLNLIKKYHLLFHSSKLTILSGFELRFSSTSCCVSLRHSSLEGCFGE